jgi:hypothetical protein
VLSISTERSAGCRGCVWHYLRDRNQLESLNVLYEKYDNVPTDELNPEEKNQLKQLIFWTAVAVIGGFVILFIIPQLI